MAKRGKTPEVLQTVISNDNDWKKLCASPGLWVIDVYKNWAGPCSCMANELKKIKQALNDDLLRFAMADVDHVSDLAGYRDTCEPQWLFVASGYKIAIMTGVNAKALKKMIEEELAKERLVLQGKAMRKILEAPSKVAKVSEGEEDEEEREEMERAIFSLKEYVDRRLMAKTVKVKRFAIFIIKSELAKLNKTDEIRKLIEESGIEVLAEKEIILTEADAYKYFDHLEDQKFFTSFIKSIISGPNILFLLTKFAYGTFIFALLQDLLGPEKVEEAKKSNPDSLRARYGVQGFINGLYASVKEEHAIKELGLFFPEIIQEQEKLKLGHAMPYQHSVVILKPVLLQNYQEDDIINDIKYFTGFDPLFRREVLFDETKATDFCGILISIDVNHFAVITESFLGGPLVVLVYGGEDMIGIIMDCIGPDISAVVEREEKEVEDEEDEEEMDEEEEEVEEEEKEEEAVEGEDEEEGEAVSEGEGESIEITVTEPETGEEEVVEIEAAVAEEPGEPDAWFQERQLIGLRIKYPVLISRTTGIHCSTSEEEAFAEMEFLFPALAMNVEAMMNSLSKGEFKLEQEEAHLNRIANAQQRLMLLIIPASFKRLGKEFICVKIQTLGFELVQQKAKMMKELEVERFLQRVGVYPSQIQALIPSFTEGPSLLLNVTSENVIEKIKQLLGPSSPQQAHATQPESLVAQFSLPGETISPIYCSTIRENIAKDILTFFSTMDDALTDDQVQDLFSPRPEGAPPVLREEPRKPGRTRKGREKPGAQVEEKVEKPQVLVGEEGLSEGVTDEAVAGFEGEEVTEMRLEIPEEEEIGSLGRASGRASEVEEAEDMELVGNQQVITPNEVLAALGIEGSSADEKEGQMSKLGLLGVIVSDFRTGRMVLDPDKLQELELGTTSEGQTQINKEKLDSIEIPDPMSYNSESEAKTSLGITDEQFDKLAAVEILEINRQTNEVTVNKSKFAQLSLGSFNPNSGKFEMNDAKLAKIAPVQQTFGSPSKMLASLGLEDLPSTEQDQLTEKMVELEFIQINSETNETSINQRKLLQAGVTALNTQLGRIELIPSKLALAARTPSKAPSELRPESPTIEGRISGEIPASLQKIENLAINVDRLGTLGVLCIQPETGHYILDQERVLKLQIASIQPVTGRFELNTARIAQLGIAQFQPEIKSYELDRETAAALGIVIVQPDEGYFKILPEKIHELGIEIGKAGTECITISQQKLSELGVAIISAEEPSMQICKPGERAYSAEMRRLMRIPCVRRPCSAPILGEVTDTEELSLWLPPVELPKLKPTPSGQPQTMEILLENAVTLIVDKEFNKIIETAIDIIAKALMEPPKNIECQKCRDELLRLYPPKPQILIKPYKQAMFPLDPSVKPEEKVSKIIQFDEEHFKMFLESSRKAAQAAIVEDTKIVERLQEPRQSVTTEDNLKESRQ